MAIFIRIMIVGLMGLWIPLQLMAGELTIMVEPGENWIHSFRILGLIKVKNPPQMAFWLEDESGNWRQNLWVTHRTAHNDWRAVPGEKKGTIQRPSALPVWRHAQPEQRSIDAVSAATPKDALCFSISLADSLLTKTYWIKAEINHSKDFNAYYPENAQKVDGNYSGGKMGSGQPSLIYAGQITDWNQLQTVNLSLCGHSHPAGDDGHLYQNWPTIDSALQIVHAIQAYWEP